MTSPKLYQIHSLSFQSHSFSDNDEMSPDPHEIGWWAIKVLSSQPDRFLSFVLGKRWLSKYFQRLPACLRLVRNVKVWGKKLTWDRLTKQRRKEIECQSLRHFFIEGIKWKSKGFSNSLNLFSTSLYSSSSPKTKWVSKCHSFQIGMRIIQKLFSYFIYVYTGRKEVKTPSFE